LDHPDRFAVEPGSNILEDVGKVFPVVLLADISEMRRDHDIVELAKRMIERQRLGLEYGQAGARHRLFPLRGYPALLSDDRPTRGVEQVRCLFHPAEFFRTNQSARPFAQHKMNCDYVGMPEQVFLGDKLRACSFSSLSCKVLTPGDRLHA